MPTYSHSKRRVKFSPHDGQKKLMREAKRFNMVNCGRRWGKTTIGSFLLSQPALGHNEFFKSAYPVAWFSPSYKSLSEVWKTMKRILNPVIADKSEQLKELELITGGRIDFWSLDNPDSGRGRKYKRIIVDEVAIIRNFPDTWKQTLRPTLTDYKGDAFFFSTPKGKSNHWYEFCQNTGKDWQYFHMPTWTNPYIPKSEIESAKQDLPLQEYLQEYEAEFLVIAGTPFFPEYAAHIHKSRNAVSIDNTEPLWLSFDFNIDPTTCIIGQKSLSGCFVFDCMEATGTSMLCELLQSVYGNHPAGFVVTGDNSGHSGSSAAGVLPGGEYNTDFNIIKEAFD